MHYVAIICRPKTVELNIGTTYETQTALNILWQDQEDVFRIVLTRLSNSVAFSPQANYTNWATATGRRNLVPTFVDRGVSRGQRGGSPTVVNLSFLDRSRYFPFK
jgi:hypothetical protein